MGRRDRLNIRDPEHLAKRLGVELRELNALAESLRRNERRHYNCWSKRKPDGRPRDITEPQPRLKAIQRKLNNLLQKVGMPEAVHGGRRGRSALSNARPHRHARSLVQTDIKDFFPSISSGRVYRVLVEDLGCSPDVAHLITRLVTLRGVVPQGTPTSSVIASLATNRLSGRLEDLAQKRGGRATVYVDDITISGVQQEERVEAKILQVIVSEGLTPHPDKTSIAGPKDQKVVTGVRVGSGVDVPRAMWAKLDRLISEIECFEAEPDPSLIRSAWGLIFHLRRLNPGATRPRERKLRRILQTPARARNVDPRPRIRPGLEPIASARSKKSPQKPHKR